MSNNNNNNNNDVEEPDPNPFQLLIFTSFLACPRDTTEDVKNNK